MSMNMIEKLKQVSAIQAIDSDEDLSVWFSEDLRRILEEWEKQRVLPDKGKRVMVFFPEEIEILKEGEKALFIGEERLLGTVAMSINLPNDEVWRYVLRESYGGIEVYRLTIDEQIRGLQWIKVKVEAREGIEMWLGLVTDGELDGLLKVLRGD